MECDGEDSRPHRFVEADTNTEEMESRLTKEEVDAVTA